MHGCAFGAHSDRRGRGGSRGVNCDTRCVFVMRARLLIVCGWTAAASPRHCIAVPLARSHIAAPVHCRAGRRHMPRASRSDPPPSKSTSIAQSIDAGISHNPHASKSTHVAFFHNVHIPKSICVGPFPKSTGGAIRIHHRYFAGITLQALPALPGA